MMAMQKFQALFCERYNCAPSQYERRALKALLYPHARLVVPLLCRLTRKFSHEDLKFIHHLGEAEDYQEAEATVSEFRGANVWSRGFWRHHCRLRVSGRKAGRLVKRLFSGS